MNIIYVRFQNFDKRFYVTSERELVRAFNILGHHGELIAYGMKKDEPDFVKLFKPFIMNPKIMKIQLAFNLFKYRHKKAVIVFDHLSYLSSVFLYIYRRVFGAKYRLLMDIRSIPVEMKKRRDVKSFRRSLRFAQRFLDGNTFITEGTRSVCSMMIKKNFVKYHIYPSGFNDDVFKYYEPNKELINELGLKDYNVIFYHGSISKKRGVEELITAINLLRDDFKIKFIVIGGGDERIKNLIKKDADNIFMDPKPHFEIPKYISTADLCVSPLPDILWWRVASSLKVMEYMASGKPIALSNMKAHTDVIPDNRKGISVFEKVDPESIAEAIRKVLLNKSGFSSDSLKLSDYARERFTYKAIAAQLIKYYETFYRY